MANKALAHRVYLALGGNLGDRVANLQGALERLRAGGHFSVTRLSNLYQTDPVGYTDQPPFLNMALEAQTDLPPLALLSYLKEVEAEMGRVASFRNAPRPIDLDIIFYDQLLYHDESLEIPHPRMANRAFVLTPLANLCPNYVHPVLQCTVANLLQDADKSGVELYPATLEIPPPRFAFVTGRLAENLLAQTLAPLAAELGFEYEICALDIDVAAFITCRFIAEHLHLSAAQSQQLTAMIVPGFVGGDLALIEDLTGVVVQRGPTDMLELKLFLQNLVQETGRADFLGSPAQSWHFYTEEQLRSMQSRLTDANIRIYTDGTRVFAFNSAVFGVAEPNDKELRRLFRLLEIDNAAHAFYLGRELYKAALSIRLHRPYHQDRDLELDD